MQSTVQAIFIIWNVLVISKKALTKLELNVDLTKRKAKYAKVINIGKLFHCP